MEHMWGFKAPRHRDASNESELNGEMQIIAVFLTFFMISNM